MQRPIKFRAWDSDRKCMFDVLGWRRRQVFNIDGTWTPVELVTFMQYTGLKDKNGKEIYENDIVESAESETEDQPYRVEFEDGCFYASSPEKSYFLHELEWEVVGNIYENPTQLDKPQEDNNHENP